MQSKTIEEWARSHRLSRSMFYKLKEQGKAPREMHIGKSVRISEDADREWVRLREAEEVA